MAPALSNKNPYPLSHWKKNSAPSTLGWLIHSKNGLAGSEPFPAVEKGGCRSFGTLLRIGKREGLEKIKKS